MRGWSGDARARSSASVSWLALSGLFALYTSFSDSYSKTYGALASGIVLLLWLNYSAFALLFGAELNSELDRQAEIRAAGGAGRPASSSPAAGLAGDVVEPLTVLGLRSEKKRSTPLPADSFPPPSPPSSLLPPPPPCFLGVIAADDDVDSPAPGSPRETALRPERGRTPRRDEKDETPRRITSIYAGEAIGLTRNGAAP